MRNKTLVFLLLGAWVLASCNSLPQINLGGSAVSPAETMELQEIQPEPTEASLPESGAVFRDEFDQDINQNWGLKVVSGLEKQMLWSQVNGKLRLQTLPPNDTNFIFLNKKNTYQDVIVTAEVENFGPLDNAFSLICRASEHGWYEFRISPSGYYELLRFDQYLQDEGKNAYSNFLEKRVGSTKIVGALNKNVFSLSCVGDVISGFVNGEQLYWEKRPLAIEDDTYGEGTIGFGLVGYGDSLDVTFNWIEVQKP